MARPLRVYDDPTEIHFVTNRCLEARHYLTPSKDLNAIVLGCLARAVEKHGVDMFGFVFMSNHFHMIVRALKLNLSDFMKHFQGNVAKKLNTFHKRSGTFFESRFKSQPVLDDEALRRVYAYVATNPTSHRLVEHPAQWPGLCAHNFLTTDTPIVGSWQEGGRRKRDRAFTIELAQLPEFEVLSKPAYAEVVAKMVDARVTELRAQRDAEGSAVLGAEEAAAVDFQEKPDAPKRSPQPRVIAACPVRRRDRLEVLLMVSALYTTALRRVRNGERDVTFPAGTFPPGWMRPVRRGERRALDRARWRRPRLGLRSDEVREAEHGHPDALLRVWPPPPRPPDEGRGAGSSRGA